MTYQEAIHILMMSPFYFRLELPDRKTLVQEFMASHGRQGKQGK